MHGAQNTHKVSDLACTPVKEFELDLDRGLGFSEVENPKSLRKLGCTIK